MSTAKIERKALAIAASITLGVTPEDLPPSVLAEGASRIFDWALHADAAPAHVKRRAWRMLRDAPIQTLRADLVESKNLVLHGLIDVALEASGTGLAPAALAH